MGERIQTFRWAAQLSKQELYNRTGISPEKLRAYEADDKKPNEEHLQKLIELFGSELVFGLDEVADQAFNNRLKINRLPRSDDGDRFFLGLRFVMTKHEFGLRPVFFQ